MESNRFGPNGLKGLIAAIRAKGLIPGVWMEMEVCSPGSVSYTHLDVYKRQGCNHRQFDRDADPVGGGDINLRAVQPAGGFYQQYPGRTCLLYTSGDGDSLFKQFGTGDFPQAY